MQDDDTASMKSYGSHKNRVFKDESHKGSAETMDGEEKRDASKEERMDHEGGKAREIETMPGPIYPNWILFPNFGCSL